MRQFLRGLGVFLMLLLVGGFTIYTVKPIAGEAERQDTVAEQWARGLANLGIRPIYPPTEDFHVGDIWAIAYANTSNAPNATVPLFPRAIRLAHVPMRDEILADALRRPRFSATSQVEAERSEVARLLREEGAGEGAAIPLASVTFPGSTTRRTIDASIEGRWLSNVFDGSRRDTVVEEVRLLKPAGYGVPAEVAAIALARWCRREQNRCTRVYALRMLEYALGEIAGDSDSISVEITFVSYVFLARAIERVVRVERNGAANLALPTVGPTGVTGANGSVKARVGNTLLNELNSTEPVPRPLAVGFRAVSMMAPVPERTQP